AHQPGVSARPDRAGGRDAARRRVRRRRRGLRPQVVRPRGLHPERALPFRRCRAPCRREPEGRRMRLWDRILAGGVIALPLGFLLGVALAAQPEHAADAADRAGSTRLAGPDGTQALYEYVERVGLSPSRADEAALDAPPGAALALVATNLSGPEAEALADR